MSSLNHNPTPEELTSSAKSLMKIAIRVGERQSPCFTPIGHPKNSVSNSFKITRHLGSEYRAAIAL